MAKSTLRFITRKVRFWTFVFVLCSGSAFGQFGSTVARRVNTGTGVPPGTCNNNPADIYVRVGATLPGFYVCLSMNTWTGPLGTGAVPGAGGANTQLQFNNANNLAGITGWTTPNGTTTITGGATSVLNLSAMTLSNIQFPSIAANSVYGNCTGAGAAPAACSLTNAMLPTTMTGITIDTATPTEVSYLSGVTSAIQTQLNAKAASNASTTVNGQACALSGTCTIPFQTNTVSNTSQAGLNFLTSTTNTVGLTVTPVNSATNAMKFEISGASYTGNAATATDLAAGSTLSVGKGGTGATTLTNHGVLLGSAASAIRATAEGTQYQFLQMGAADPGWSSWKLPATGGTNAQCLTSNGTDAVWAGCATGSITGTLTPGTIPKASGVSALSDSLLTDDATTLGYSGTGGLYLSGVNASLKIIEGAAPTGAAGSDWLYPDSGAHRWKVKNNSNTADTLALFSDKLSVFAATTSAELAGVISDETGSGVVAYATSPAFTTDIHCAVAGACTLGTAANPASSVYVGGAGTNNIRITGTATGARTATLPDATGTFVLDSGADTTTSHVLHATATPHVYTASGIVVGDLPIVTAAKGGTGTDLSAAAAGLYPKSNGSGAFVASTLAASGVGSCTNQAVTGLNGDAAPTCTTLTSAYVNNSIALTGVDINTSNQVTVTHLAAALPVNQGGSGALTFTAHGVLLGNAASAFGVTAVGSTGIPLVGVTGADPAFGTASVAGGGTGATTLTAHGLLIGQGTSAITATAAGTQYQFLQMGATDPGWSSWQLPATGGSNAQCLTSNGTNAVWGSCSTGSITGSGLVAGQVAVAAGASSITSYSGFTSDASGNVTAASYTASSSVAGAAYLGGGTAAPTTTGAIGHAAPTTGITAYNDVWPATAQTGYVKFSTSSGQTGCTASSTNMCGIYETAINLASADVTGILGTSNGGFGIATNASTGVPTVSSGTWSIGTSPALGTPTVTTINGLTPTALSVGWSLAGGTTSKTLTLSNTMTLAASADGQTFTFPATSAAIGIANPPLDKSTNGLSNPTADATFTYPISSTSGLTLAGTAPASVGGDGTAASTLFNVNGITGGASSSTGTNIAGTGSSPTIASGAGGAATGAGTNNTIGGAGGTITLTTGAGGAGGAGNDTGGSGGNISLHTGNGGSASGTGINSSGGSINVILGKAGTGGSGTAGTGGTFLINGTTPTSLSTNGQAAGPIFSIQGLNGGATTGTSTTGGVGSLISMTAGDGGSGAGGTNAKGGAGGYITITAGSGGTSGGSSANANGGNIILVPGSAGTGGGGAAGSAGAVVISGMATGVVQSSSGTLSGSTTLPSSLVIPTPSMTPQFVDCHTACTGGSALTAAQLSNAIVSNISLAGTAQANSAVAMTGPAPAQGMNFIMILGSAEGASATWTYNSTAANVYLDGSTTAVTNIGFGNSAAIGSSISCFSFPIAGPAFALKCTTLAGTSTSS